MGTGTACCRVLFRHISPRLPPCQQIASFRRAALLRATLTDLSTVRRSAVLHYGDHHYPSGAILTYFGDILTPLGSMQANRGDD